MGLLGMFSNKKVASDNPESPSTYDTLKYRKIYDKYNEDTQTTGDTSQPFNEWVKQYTQPQMDAKRNK